MRAIYPWPIVLVKALRAALDLAHARLLLRTITPDGVLQRNAAMARQARQAGRPADPASSTLSCDEAAFFIGRMAVRVPWRSDCLVQALAGQQWLARAGVTSEIVVGTARQDDGGFLSHAWLRHGSRIVLGGDISRYTPMLETDPD